MGHFSLRCSVTLPSLELNQCHSAQTFILLHKRSFYTIAYLKCSRAIFNDHEKLQVHPAALAAVIIWIGCVCRHIASLLKRLITVMNAFDTFSCYGVFTRVLKHVGRGMQPFSFDESNHKC